MITGWPGSAMSSLAAWHVAVPAPERYFRSEQLLMLTSGT